MVQRVQVVLEDDLNGGDADETVRFSLDGVDYEIDLNEVNARKLRDELAPWISHARRATRGRAGGAANGRSRSRADAGEIRDWARANGMEVSSRGRVPSEVRAAYERANA